MRYQCSSVPDSQPVSSITANPLGSCGQSTGAEFATVTETGADVDEFPAASRTTAVNVCAAFDAAVVFHDTEYGAVVSSAPRFAPSSLNCTPATPTLSLAFAVTLTVPEIVAPAAGAVSATVGCVVSGTPPPVARQPI